MSGENPESEKYEQEMGSLDWEYSKSCASHLLASRGNLDYSYWNPQRLYARFQLRLEKIQSGLHGDMQRVAEMSHSTSQGSFPQRLKPVCWVASIGTTVSRALPGSAKG